MRLMAPGVARRGMANKHRRAGEASGARTGPLREPGTRRRRIVPEWWGLRVDGNLVRVIHWPAARPPALPDFTAADLNGADYEISPVHGAPAE
jgi:hypothetical protein